MSEDKFIEQLAKHEGHTETLPRDRRTKEIKKTIVYNLSKIKLTDLSK